MATSEKLSYGMDEAQAISSLSRHSLYKANKRGLLPFRKFGSKTLIMRADLEKFLNGLTGDLLRDRSPNGRKGKRKAA